MMPFASLNNFALPFHSSKRYTPPLIVAAALAYWSGSPVRPDFSTFVMITAVFMVVAMWIFPEAGVKKGDVKEL